MDNDYGTSLGMRASRVATVITIIVVLFCAYLIVSAVITAETTGVLKVASAQKATISVGRMNSQAKIIGVANKTDVRLKPGTYWVEAITSSGEVAAQTFSIDKKQSVKVGLTPAASPKLPSVSDVSFFGMSALTNLGISSGQVDILKMDFFRFKTSAGAVSIDTRSVKTPPYILGNPSVITFNVNIDSHTYAARITYADMYNVQLQIYGHSGRLVFDSSTAANIKNLE